MGTAHRWRPAIYLAVTLPMIRAERSAGSPEVTTRILDTRIGDGAPAGVSTRIGG